MADLPTADLAEARACLQRIIDECATAGADGWFGESADLRSLVLREARRALALLNPADAGELGRRDR